jgi:hypothetical protein
MVLYGALSLIRAEPKILHTSLADSTNHLQAPELEIYDIARKICVIRPASKVNVMEYAKHCRANTGEYIQ